MAANYECPADGSELVIYGKAGEILTFKSNGYPLTTTTNCTIVVKVRFFLVFLYYSKLPNLGP